MNAYKVLAIGLVGIAFLVGYWAYPVLPEQVPMHWNEHGQVNGYGSREMGAFFVPVLMIGMFLLLEVLPKIEVFQRHARQHQDAFEQLRFVLMAFFVYMFILTLLPNFGYTLNLFQAMLPGFAFLFYYLGHLLPRFKRNFFVGIRTPWVFTSDEVWRKTHEMGGKTFQLNAFVLLLAVFSEGYAFWLLMISIIGNVLFLFVYSYLEYRKIPLSKRDRHFQ